MDSRRQERKSIINIGTSLMVVIMIGLSLAVIAALAISSSRNNYDLSQRLAEHTTDYYNASNEAYEAIAKDNWADSEYNIQINDTQELHVKVENKTITAWKVENTGSWEGDTDIVVIE